MSINLPFKQTDRIIELGGGTNSLKRHGLNVINVDKNPGEGVDIVRDLEKDFSDLGIYDGLVSIYLAEHIRWRFIQQFFNNCAKIVNVGGVAVFIVPDSREQMKKLLEKEDWDERDSEFLFGGQDYPDNTHKTLLDKKYISRMLYNAGFSKIEIVPHPDPNARDMIVYAWTTEILTGMLVKGEDVKKLLHEEEHTVNSSSLSIELIHQYLRDEIKEGSQP